MNVTVHNNNNNNQIHRLRAQTHPITNLINQSFHPSSKHAASVSKMIFSIHFSLIMAGYSACGILLGSYMMKYAGANELDLGFIFMVQPLAVFVRPFINAMADRYQTHKQLLTKCCFVNFLVYIPFALLPFLLQHPQLADILTVRLRFWVLVICHALGSIAFCGVRSLGDALAVNYAKRVGSDFSVYRKYGAVSFGVCGLLLGQINQNWILPDFVPSFLMNIVAILMLTILIYLWPEEYFVMFAQKTSDELQVQRQLRLSRSGSLKRGSSLTVSRESSITDELPVGGELFRRIMQKLTQTLCFCCPSEEDKNRKLDSSNRLRVASIANLSPIQLAGQKQTDGQPTTSDQLAVGSDLGEQEPLKTLSLKQQIQIFWLLMQRDIRLPLFLLLLFYGGFVGYAPPNFVFTYMNVFCYEKGTCDGAALSGLVMISYCLCETICYIIINRLRLKLNYFLLLQLTLVSLTIHYYAYGFLLPYYLSPYIFLFESMHGLEYSSSLASCVELGYRFANEVDLLIPELIERKIISERDNTELVRLSLLATMSGCFTLVYDGFGTIIGSFIYGLTTDTYSFTFTWRLIGTLSAAGFLGVFLVGSVGKCLGIKPQIHKLKAERYGGAAGGPHDERMNSSHDARLSKA